MGDAAELRATMLRYLKARIPFVSIRSDERNRVSSIVEDIAGAELSGLTFLEFMPGVGLRDLRTHNVVNDDQSILGALQWIQGTFLRAQNLSVLLSDVPNLSDETPESRKLYDTCNLGLSNGGVVMAVTSDSVWPRLQRIGMSMTLDHPNEAEMNALIVEQLDAHRGQVPIEWDDIDCRRAASILTGISAVEAENVIVTLLANGSVTKGDLAEVSRAKDRVFSDISGIERVTLGELDYQVGGLAGLRAWLRRERHFLTADLAHRQMKPPRGVLLVGVPGCGKSLSAKAIASSWELPLYRLDMASIMGQYVGQSEGRLKEAFQTADHVAPCVLWIDEIEKGLAGIGSDSTGVTTRLVGQFLFWLQESTARVFVVATANDVSALPPELLRRGRFDELFFVDLPEEDERREIIEIYAARYVPGRKVDDELMGDLVELSEGFSGADIEAAVREVGKEAELRGDDAAVSDDFVIRAFRNIVPLVRTNPERIAAIRQWGAERAVPASGKAISAVSAEPRKGRVVLT